MQGFLLSLEELSFELKYSTVQERTPLKYFDGNYSRKVASLPDGTENIYWTRTPSLGETFTITFIGPKAVRSASADLSLGVRPAFCVERSTPVVQSTDVVEGEAVFIIE